MTAKACSPDRKKGQARVSRASWGAQAEHTHFICGRDKKSGHNEKCGHVEKSTIKHGCLMPLCGSMTQPCNLSPADKRLLKPACSICAGERHWYPPPPL